MILSEKDFLYFFKRNNFELNKKYFIKKEEIDNLFFYISDNYDLKFALFIDLSITEKNYFNSEIEFNFENYQEAYDCYISFLTGFEGNKC